MKKDGAGVPAKGPLAECTLILESKQLFGGGADVDRRFGQFGQFLIRLFFFLKGLKSSLTPSLSPSNSA